MLERTIKRKCTDKISSYIKHSKVKKGTLEDNENSAFYCRNEDAYCLQNNKHNYLLMIILMLLSNKTGKGCFFQKEAMCQSAVNVQWSFQSIPLMNPSQCKLLEGEGDVISPPLLDQMPHSNIPSWLSLKNSIFLQI